MKRENIQSVTFFSSQHPRKTLKRFLVLHRHLSMALNEEFNKINSNFDLNFVESFNLKLLDGGNRRPAKRTQEKCISFGSAAICRTIFTRLYYKLCSTNLVDAIYQLATGF